VIYLLLGVGICFLIPWLPVLLLRLAPVREVPPLSPEELARLAARLRPRRPAATARPRRGEAIPQAITAPPSGEHVPARAEPASTGATHTPRETTDALDHLTLRSYQWVNLVVLPVFLVSMLGLAILWAVLFNFLAEQHARTFPPGVFLFTPAVYWAVFGVPAVFLGIFTTAGILEPFVRILLGRRYAEYCYWEQARRGLSGPAGVQLYGRRFKLFAWLLGVLMAAWVVLAMNWYVRFTEEAIAIQPLFGIKERVYPYNRVQQVVLTTHVVVKRDVIPREGLHLRFDDGQTWSTGQTFAVPDAPGERKRLLEFLMSKTGKPILQARLIEEVPGW
jgi:hypothetical protein